MARRGSALITVLIMGLVLFTLLKALIILSHGNAFRAKTYQDRVLAGYALEAGVADAMMQLKTVPNWTAGFIDKELRHGPGTYSVQFAASGNTPGPDDSVNNLGGLGAVDGPRGALSVMAGSAEIIVTARVAGVTRRALVVVEGSSGSSLGTNVVASNHILMRGNVRVSGVKDLETGAAVDAGLHSNVGGSATNLIQWSPIDGDESLDIRGMVSAVSTNPAAIDLQGGSPSGGIQTGASAHNPPVVDIANKVDTASGPNPPVASGGTLNSGTYKSSGDLNVVGDLKLEPGSKLYVNGNLSVKGSISGTGEIYVKGSTEVEGDIHLTSADGVGLFSKGSVKLSGFNTSEYIDQVIASDPSIQPVAADAICYMDQIQCYFESYPTSQLLDGTQEHQDLHCMLDALTGDNGGADLIGQLITKFQSEPPSPARDATIAKLKDIDRMASVEPNWADAKTDWLSGANAQPGIIDVAMHEADPALLQEVLTKFCASSSGDIGKVFFQGTIYTDGYIYANSDVSVVGAVFATGNNTSVLDATIDGQLVSRGDIFMNRDVSLILNEKAIEALSGPISGGTGSVKLKSWIEI